jgi:hypothetical protein
LDLEQRFRLFGDLAPESVWIFIEDNGHEPRWAEAVDLLAEWQGIDGPEAERRLVDAIGRDDVIAGREDDALVWRLSLPDSRQQRSPGGTSI